ncbi:MAG TPA: glycosyltransferase family 4 protein [Gammaproteobacteria bacterium]
MQRELPADQGLTALLGHVNLAHTYRGGERQTELLIRGLSAYLPRQRAVVRAGRPLAERLTDVPGVTVVPVGGRLAAVRAMKGCTLVHAHETGGAQAALVRHLLSGTPYVVTRRVDKRPKPDPFTRAMYTHAAAIAGLSSAVVRSLESYDPSLEPRRIPSAASGVPSDPAWVDAFRARFPGKFLVGHVAAIDVEHKGQLTLVAAAAKLERDHPQIHFIVVGSGRDEERVRRAAAPLSNMSFTGWVDNVGDHLAAFDLFAFPSKHEGLGSILLDAMQFGLPIVATSVGGIPDLVVDGENGILIAEDDSDALAAAIARLFSDAALRDAIARANRLRARDYQPEIMTARYLELYRELVPELAPSSAGALP